MRNMQHPRVDDCCLVLPQVFFFYACRVLFYFFLCLLFTAPKCQCIGKMDPLQVRVLPVGNFTGAKYQNASQCEPFCQSVQDLALTPTAKINQHVLTKN